MIRFLFLLTAMLAAVSATACDHAIADPSSSSLENAPSRVKIAGSELRLETYLWRDFMPIAPPDGQPLIAVLRIRTTDGSPFPAGIKAEQVSILKGADVWTAPVKQEHPSTEPGVLEVVARNGPKWGPGINVDVVVQLRDSNSQIHRLRAADQPIQRTD
jgi:hypothetical protein